MQLLQLVDQRRFPHHRRVQSGAFSIAQRVQVAPKDSHCGAFSIAQRARVPPSIHMRLGLFRLHTFWALCNRFGGVRSIDFGANSKIN